MVPGITVTALVVGKRPGHLRVCKEFQTEIFQPKKINFQLKAVGADARLLKLLLQTRSALRVTLPPENGGMLLEALSLQESRRKESGSTEAQLLI